MNRYTFTATRRWYGPGYRLTEGDLRGILANVVVRRLVAHANGSHDIELQFQRPSHAIALDEIAATLEGFSLDVAQAVITEVVSDALTGALLGGSVGAAGGASTKNGTATLVSALVGASVGLVVGVARERIVAQFEAYRQYPGGPWFFHRLDRPPAPDPA